MRRLATLMRVALPLEADILRTMCFLADDRDLEGVLERPFLLGTPMS